MGDHASEATPAAPKPASTVVLARDRAGGGVEVFLVQRHGSMGFMGGMHVFPGGKLCAADGAERMHAQIADRAVAARRAAWGDGVSAGEAVARAVAAVRETFEEAGVLLCADAACVPGPELARMRAALLGGADFGELLERAGVRLELARLQPLARWITPEGEHVRFDTSFYVARAPADQQASHDERESAAAGWFTPVDALEAARQARLRLAPPTAVTLESLRDAATVDAALASATRRPPPVIQPILRWEGSALWVLYPGDPEHPVRSPAFAGPTRRVLRQSGN